MADIVPKWMWRDPGEVIERLIADSSRRNAPRQPWVQTHARPAARDRYYTQARRIEVRAAVQKVTNHGGGKHE